MRGANMKMTIWILSITQVITLAWLLVLTGRTGVQWYSAEWWACVEGSSRNRDVLADMEWQRNCAAQKPSPADCSDAPPSRWHRALPGSSARV